MPLKDLARRNLVGMMTHLKRSGQLSKTHQVRLVNLCLLQQERIAQLEELAVKNAEAIRQDALDLGAWGRRWFYAKSVGNHLCILMRELIADGVVMGGREVDLLRQWEGVDDVL